MKWPIDKPLDKWSRGDEWGIVPLKEETWEYANTVTALDLNYQIVPIEHEGHELYDPMRDTPDLYLNFIRLAEFRENWGIRFQGNEKDCINKVLKFFQDYGPLWFPGGPVDYDRDSNVPFIQPLTIVRVLCETRDMAYVVQTYKLLRDIEERKKPVSELIAKLKEQMLKLQDKDRPYGVKDHLVTTEEGLRVSGHIFEKDGQLRYPPLNNDEEIIAAAIAYVIARMNEKLGVNQVYLTLANQEGRSDKQKDESQIGAWISAYRYYSLLTVLWLQFYLAILNNARLKECANKECPRWKLFVPKRTKQEYCSNNCRVAQHMRDQYKPKKEANNERLHQEKQQ